MKKSGQEVQTTSAASGSLLWDPDTLAVHLDDDGVVVLDVRRGERYANGHIPGARNFSVYGINTYDSDPAPLASFTRMWAFQLVGAGIRREDTVVVYSEFTDESAARAFWFLEYLGHERVAVLDGGVRAWEASGHGLTHEATAPAASVYRHEPVESVCAAWSDVAAAINDPSVVILDTRTDGEWYGEDSRGAARGGAVPGAVHLEWIHNLDDTGRMLDADRLRERYASVGITAETPVIAYCNTGYRSAHAYLALRLTGHPNVRNYVASWQEWGSRMECPVVVHGRG